MSGPIDAPFDGPDDATVQALRQALGREAAAVRPSPDGLARITARIAAENAAENTTEHATGPMPGARTGSPAGARPPRRFAQRPGGGSWWPALAAAAAVLVIGTGAGLALRPDGRGVDQVTVDGGVAAAPGQPVVEPLPVYFAQRQSGRWALVREFRPTRLTDPAQRLQAAVELAVAGAAGDPDDTSVWRHRGLTGQVSARVEGGRVSVVLGRTLLGRSSAVDDAELARLALQQVVWTATATTGTVTPVTVTSAEPEGLLLGTIPLGATFERSTGSRDPRAPVWVSSLNDRQSLTVGTATIHGDAAPAPAGGGTVTWSIRRLGAGGDGPREIARATTPLVDGQARPAPAGQRGRWSARLPLPEPGAYEVVVRAAWPDGTGEWVETRTITVS